MEKREGLRILREGPSSSYGVIVPSHTSDEFLGNLSHQKRRKRFFFMRFQLPLPPFGGLGFSLIALEG